MERLGFALVANFGLFYQLIFCVMAAALHGFHFFPSVSFQLFTAAFPLAPLIALLTNAIDMKVDARRLLWTNRRPVAFRAEDIGG